MNQLLDHIAILIGQENLLTDSASLAAYATAANYCGINWQSRMPLAVARPRHPAQLARMLAFCASEKAPLVIRGNGTKPVPRPDLEGKILLAMDGLDRIYGINAVNRSVHVQAGVSSRRLREALAAKNLFCPIEAFGTVGGTLSVNPATCQSLKYGAIGNFVSSLEIVLASGERIHTPLQGDSPASLPGQLPLAGVICGSMGQLAVIAECHLRLLPAPGARTMLVFRFVSPGEAAEAARTILSAPLAPSSLKICDSECAQALGMGQNPFLAVGFEGCKSEVEFARNVCCEMFADSKPEQILEESGLEQSGFAAVFPLLVKYKGPFTLASAACAPDRLADLLTLIRNLASEFEIDIAMYGDAAVAHIKIAVFGSARAENIAAFEKRLFASELMLNEALGHEEDADFSRQDWETAHPASITSALKALFDSAGVLNASPDWRQP